MNQAANADRLPGAGPGTGQRFRTRPHGNWDVCSAMRDLRGPRVLLRRLRESWRSRWSRRSGSTASSGRSRRTWSPRCARSTCCAPTACSNSTPPRASTRTAVHLAQLRLGQGLVGTIAAAPRSLNLSDAQSHPAFTYLPETGEEIYNSFLGVPILRAGRTLGVLVVQNEAHRNYGEDEVEALETTAMVLAEMIAAGELKRSPGRDRTRSQPAGHDPRRPWRGHRSRPCRAARAAHRRHQPLQRGQRRRAEAADATRSDRCG